MKKFYLLDNDYLFKNIFREEAYLKHLLKTFFGVNAKKIKYLNTELIKDNNMQKVGIVDLLLEVDGEIVILELQNIDEHNFEERILFYPSCIISKYCLKKGDDYKNLKSIKVYAIINYNGFNDNVLDIVNLKRKNKIFTKKLEYKILDLTKVSENQPFYELASLFKNTNILNQNINDKTNQEILEKIKIYNLDERSYKKMDDIAQMMMNETRHYENAFIDGKYEGKREGKLEEKNEIAKNMLKENININVIVKITGLTSKQILSLQ